jgi:Xaa-Pro aminopeptidase
MIPARFMTTGFDKSRLTALMKEHRIDAILLATPENVLYTTGYPCVSSGGNPILYALKNQFPFFSFIEADGRVTLFCWIGAILGSVEFAVDHTEVYLDRPGAIELLKNFFAVRGLDGKTVGVESACPWFAVRLIEESARPKGVAVIDGIIQSLRLIKSPEELEMIKKSTAIAEATFTELAAIVKPGISRPQLIQEAKYRMIKNGATGIGHTTISFGTSNPEVSIEETLGKDKLVAIDIGARYYGWASDIRRHVYSGAVPDELARLHSVMCGIVDEIGAMLVPGQTAATLHDSAVALYQKNGLDPFVITVGHSIGLETEEQWLYRGSDLTLSAGMVVNVELYTNKEEGVEVGDEQTYLITDTAPVRLTTLPREIISV